MNENPLKRIQQFGQNIWLDFIRRKMLLSGELKRLIDEDGIRGVTSNPAIFEKAIAGSSDYDDAIETLALKGLSTEAIYTALTVEDVQMTADLLRPLYDSSDGRFGFVSLEVNPHLARDVDGTLAEARQLWQAVNRPNAMIKVPATQQGLTCIRQLIAEGINVNVTLLFGLPRYREVAEAYIGGLEDRAAAGKPLAHVASVASFFLSRIDVMIDAKLAQIGASRPQAGDAAETIYGEVAIASAKCAYQIYHEMFVAGDRFDALREKGARIQRVLWASTSTKDPQFSDVRYVEALIGPDTVNTLPRETIDAYRDHGRPQRRLTRDLETAHAVLARLAELDINIEQVAGELEAQGIEKFIQPYDRTLQTLEKARQAALKAPIDRQTIAVDGDTDARIGSCLTQLQGNNFNARLWQKDADLWNYAADGKQSVVNGLGWLDVVSAMQENVEALTAFRDELREAGFRWVLHMGMGGSSLAPLVFQRAFAVGGEGLSLQVLDTTDPATIDDIEHRLPLSQTLFITASKSGTTTEPLAFGDYFYERLRQMKGDAAGDHFVAVTDPGTPLADLARKRRYRRTFLNPPDIGGRYSALSFFGMLPAALMGLDIGEMLHRAQRMAHACAADRNAESSPGVILGAALGQLARHGRDKVTFFVPPGLEPLGMWLEQLLAESTGKNGTGLLPVAGEPAAPPSAYGDDRVFVHITLDSEADERLSRSAEALRSAGHPLITIRLKDRLDIAQEFFRWEVATATAGAVLEINPFDQPNVQESKDNTRRLLDAYQQEGRLPDDAPPLTEGPLQLYLPTGTAEDTLPETLARFLSQVRAGDYIALLAYLTESAAVDTLLDGIRMRLQHRFKTAVTMGYGPRYLHSTGQIHKGGPTTGCFIQLTADDAADEKIPDAAYTFGTLRKAQARGDLEALVRHGQRALRLHLGPDPAEGLVRLNRVLDRVLITSDEPGARRSSR